MTDKKRKRCVNVIVIANTKEMSCSGFDYSEMSGKCRKTLHLHSSPWNNYKGIDKFITPRIHPIIHSSDFQMQHATNRNRNKQPKRKERNAILIFLAITRTFPTATWVDWVEKILEHFCCVSFIGWWWKWEILQWIFACLRFVMFEEFLHP